VGFRDLGREERLELVVEDDAKVFGEDMVVVAVADNNAERVAGADALGYEALLVVDLRACQYILCPERRMEMSTVGATSCRRWKKIITSCWASNLRTKCV
jgi:hypothetical protein